MRKNPSFWKLHNDLWPLLLLLFCWNLTSSQESIESCRIQHGLNIGVGVHQFFKDEFVYRPYLFLYHASMPVSRSDHHVFSIYAEPQFIPVKYNQDWKLEFGLNAGFSMTSRLQHGLHSFISIGSGPHYISASTPRQASGFIFSDNITVGLNKQLKISHQQYDLKIMYRFRHISNAGLRQPNGGMNNGFVIIGIQKKIRKSIDRRP